ncbi:MAG TPA: hypothetical protein VFU36_08340 [Jatrophihabitans sp.]|nr:hypothetical protein [Jatrophihabitans sp.]
MDDVLTLQPLLPEAAFFPANGRPNALNCARDLINAKLSKFACVVDRDFDDDPHLDLERVFPYLCQDLESMLIEIGCLGDLLPHYASAGKLVGKASVKAMIADLCISASIVGNLRRANAAERWGLAFDRVDLTSKIDKRTLILNLPSYCAALISVSDSRVTREQLLRAAQVETERLVYSGKDVMAFVSVALRRKYGSLSGQESSVEVLCPALRACGSYKIASISWFGELKAILAA